MVCAALMKGHDCCWLYKAQFKMVVERERTCACGWGVREEEEEAGTGGAGAGDDALL